MSTQLKEIKTNGFRKMDSLEPEWLYHVRRNGWAAYNELPLPERIVHLWKYSDPSGFLFKNLDDLMSIRIPLTDDAEAVNGEIWQELSAYAYNRSDLMTFAKIHPDLESSGIIFKNLLAAIRENENIVGNHLGRLIGRDFGKFEALNLALWNTGLFLHIPDNTILENPIRLQRHPSGPATLHRLLVILGKNVKATIIDDYSGECRKEDAQINSVVEIFVGDQSQAKYINIQRHGEKCHTYITQRTDVGVDAQIYSVFAGLGSSYSKINAGSVLSGAGAESKMYGLAFGNNKQHFDYHTLHHHRTGNSLSNIDFKIALKDSANSAYTGLIKIDESALNCEAYQENRNLLLNKGPRAESIPELEILCDQVQCTHGATVGPIDPEALFYLESRGLNRDQAIRTIVTGFVEPTLRQLPGNIKEITRSLIMEKLEG
jgi:Fe-S cluster assembly protein SufD